MSNVSRQAVRLHLLSYTDKELTNSLVLASDWLSNISVWFGLTKRDSEKSKIPLLLQICGIWKWFFCCLCGKLHLHSKALWRFLVDSVLVKFLAFLYCSEIFWKIPCPTLPEWHPAHPSKRSLQSVNKKQMWAKDSLVSYQV